jgi:hypothetical protein
MRKHCSNVRKLRPFLDKGKKKLARMRTIATAAAVFANGTYFLDNLREKNEYSKDSRIKSHHVTSFPHQVSTKQP